MVVGSWQSGCQHPPEGWKEKTLFSSQNGVYVFVCVLLKQSSSCIRRPPPPLLFSPSFLSPSRHQAMPSYLFFLFFYSFSLPWNSVEQIENNFLRFFTQFLDWMMKFWFFSLHQSFQLWLLPCLIDLYFTWVIHPLRFPSSCFHRSRWRCVRIRSPCLSAATVCRLEAESRNRQTWPNKK